MIALRSQKDAEEEEINEFEAKIGICLPADMRTVHNIRRWLDGWQRDARKIRKLLHSYMLNRKAAALEDPNLIEQYQQNIYVQKVLPYIRMSTRPMVINEVDNTVVIVNQLGGIDYHRFSKVISVRDLLMFYFVTAEYALKQVLLQEKRTGQSSGLTLIYDFNGFQVKDYLNPYSPIMQTFALGAKMLQEYYCELLNGLYVLNAGAVFKTVLLIAKTVLVPRTFNKMHIIHGSSGLQNLLMKISANALPLAYGGTWTETNPLLNVSSCCTLCKPLAQAPHYKAKRLPNSSAVTIKPSNLHIRRVKINKGQRLLWCFASTGKLEFSIYKSDKENELILIVPRMVLCTPLGMEFPDQGNVMCEQAGEYAIEFRNVHTSFFVIKVHYSWAVE
ncbi:CRAL TRIO domain containing protein [Trichuris trichiura]|uniref:CRAL TRIO domain containing protein n=1 Tax=Trichuris trichiura TaxID=36087 RepID=A0A077ZC25_TRITR|nr:CRAL TRIO domain containing protein [Trichuris trichiura]